MWMGMLAAAIAGSTIFLGLPVARLSGASERLRAVLSLVAAGVLLFLIIEIGHEAIERVEASVRDASASAALQSGLLFVTGLTAGLIGLAWIEERHAHADGSEVTEMATMIAVGIGLHNFALGLAIGQSFAGGTAHLGVPLLLGFALHNATEGFGIAGVIVGRKVSWLRLGALGLIASLPTVVGAGLGGVWVNTNIELLCLSLATGSLLFVARELLRLRFQSLGIVASVTAIASGFLLGLAAELVVGVTQIGGS
jgi:ZIP family zinc transporter